MAYMDIAPPQRQGANPGWSPDPAQRFGVEPWLYAGYTGPDPNSPDYPAWARAQFQQPPLGEGITPVGDPQATGTYFPGYGPGGKIAPSPFSPGQGAPGVPGTPGGAFNQYAQRGPFGDLSSFQSHYFYQDNPQIAYRQFMDYLDPNPNSAFSRYAQDAYSRLYQQYLTRQSQPGHMNDLWTDALTGTGGQLQGEFSALSPSQRGEHPVQFSRWLGG